MERLLCFCGRDVSDWAEKSAVVIPVDPLEGFPFDLAHRFPWADLLDDLCFEQADHALGQDPDWPYAVASGAGVKIGSIFGCAAGTAAYGATVDGVTVGIFDLAKVSTEVHTVGLPLFWDDTAKLVTTDNDEGANIRIGLAVEARANPISLELPIIPVLRQVFGRQPDVRFGFPCHCPRQTLPE